MNMSMSMSKSRSTKRVKRKRNMNNSDHIEELKKTMKRRWREFIIQNI